MKRRPNVSSGSLKLSRARFIPNGGLLPKPLYLSRTVKASPPVRLFQSTPTAFNDRLTNKVWRSPKIKTAVRIPTKNKILYSPIAVSVGDTVPEKSVCKLRAERRETMFAQGSAGRGYRTRKDNTTRDIKC